LAGQGAPADADIVALNAGALLHLAGRASTLAEGGALARDTLRSGSPARVLAAFAEASHG
ncbi:MAG: anthranilate phosphoribosyltransferase, partial [Parvularculaceae bacterium]|nr:anthranilate phosphoribosyltransferase [Parvularculaceae bacterium]